MKPYRWSLLPILVAMSVHGAAAPQSLADCEVCHGTDGVAAKAGVPHINAMLAPYVIDSLAAFATGRRASSVTLHRMSEEDRAAAAQFYAAQSPSRPRQDLDPAVIARGESVYSSRCADCHIEGDREAPSLFAQDKSYLLSQAYAFKNGKRLFPFMMDDAYKGLSDEQLAAVVEYLAAQEPGSLVKKKRKR